MAILTGTPIGTFIDEEGGYLGGFISHNQDGKATHALIVSQGEDGDAGSLQQGFPPAGTATSLFDGKANHDEIVASGVTYTAVTWIENNLNTPAFNGFSDWYLASRAEMDILFWNLKPQDVDNNTADQLPNPFATPPRGNDRTLTVPGQTEVATFQGLVDNAIAGAYWTSSRDAAGTGSYQQDTQTGGTAGRQLFSTSSTLNLLVRGIRRVEALDGPVTPEQKFNATYANASSAEPMITALNSPTAIQRCIDTAAAFLATNPDDHFVDAIIGLGNMHLLQLAQPYFVKTNQPGLRDGKKVLLKGIAAQSALPDKPITLHFVG